MAGSHALDLRLVPLTAGTSRRTVGQSTDHENRGNTAQRIRVLRRMPRVAVDCPVWIVRPSGEVAARIANASSTGLGLVGPDLGAAGDPIRLRLPDRRHLDGEVRWRSADRCGVRLYASLAPDDALLRPAPNDEATTALLPEPTTEQPLPTRMLTRAIREMGAAWLAEHAFGPRIGCEREADENAPDTTDIEAQLKVLAAMSIRTDLKNEAARQRLSDAARRLADLLEQR